MKESINQSFNQSINFIIKTFLPFTFATTNMTQASPPLLHQQAVLH
jgi:hypothetical protein